MGLAILLTVGLYGVTAYAKAYVRHDAQRTFRPAPDETAKALYLFIKERQQKQSGKTAHFASSEVELFYGMRGYRPLWSRKRQIHPHAYELEAMIADAYKEGLNPGNPQYHLHAIRHLMYQEAGEQEAEKRLAKLDVLLSEAFFALGHHLFQGMAYGSDVSGMHHNGKKTVDMAELLQRSIVDNTVAKNLAKLTPRYPEYLALKRMLVRYRNIEKEGGWSTNKADYLQKGGSAEKAVTQRLRLSGDMDDGTGVSVLASQRLKRAIQRFQERHDIAADGIVGRKTAEKMAVPVGEYIAKIRLNMERWRWRNEPIGRNHILVNIPDFSLSVVEKKKPVMSMNVIVGREGRKTPTFDATMSYLVFNPYWRIPKTILNEDMLPGIRRDKNFFEKRGIRIFNFEDTNELDPVDPSEIDWKRWRSGDEKKYRFRQNPGRGNPLGYVKFIFPNSFNIYFHDTPNKKLFGSGNNMASSGCIRLQKPFELARYLLEKEQGDVTRKSILKIVHEGDTQIVWLTRPVPVYITYQTAWIDGNGDLNVRDDAYGFDEKLEAILAQKL